jgi:hypothetical protein
MHVEPVKVVVRYSDGRIIKGGTKDFFPNRNRFHLSLADKPSREAVEVFVNDLKAVYIVRDFIGDPSYQKPFSQMPSFPQPPFTLLESPAARSGDDDYSFSSEPR